jgi:hypothetical protein
MVLALGERQALMSMPRRLDLSRCQGLPRPRGWPIFARPAGTGVASRADRQAEPSAHDHPRAVVLGEPIGWKVAAGVAMMTAGALLTIM